MRVAVCGARDGGVDTGYRISVLGAEVVLLERSPVSRSLGYMMNFFRPGYGTAQAMGLLPAVNDIAYDICVGSLAVWVGETRRRVLRSVQGSPRSLHRGVADGVFASPRGVTSQPAAAMHPVTLPR